MKPRFYSIITTIQPPTPAVRLLSSRLRELDAKLVVVGDKKGPPSYAVEDAEFLSLKDQLDLAFTLAGKLPTGHYTRKNMGYLSAIAQDAACIYETDDDNAPLEQWTLRQERVPVRVVRESGWVNVYRLFTDNRIWPRGLPLDEVTLSHVKRPAVADETISVRAPVQQGLAENSPDVDAIWRLTLDQPFYFEAGPSVYLPKSAWCPFNSQSTWWWPAAYPLLYLPSYCTSRMTDIWRSFVAQRCLWEIETGVVFHASEVSQERNEHNLMRDFTDEIPGYIRNRELAAILENLVLEKGEGAVADNLLRCYEELIRAEFFPETELELVNAWLSDLCNLRRESTDRVADSISL